LSVSDVRHLRAGAFWELARRPSGQMHIFLTTSCEASWLVKSRSRVI
jgi:hypothetical protein